MGWGVGAGMVTPTPFVAGHTHPLLFFGAEKDLMTNDLRNTASYGQTNALASAVLKTLAEREATIGYGMLACALTIGRLLNPGKVLADDDEIKFIEALMDWAGAYFNVGKAN